MSNTPGQDDNILLKINVSGRDQLQGANKDAKDLQKTIQGGANVELDKPVLSLRQQLRLAIVDAQKLAESGKQNTQEFVTAAKRVAEIKDKVEDLNRTFKAFDPDNKFKVFVSVAQSGARIVQGYAGAMAFLGVKSEDAAETIAKLQGIMAFADAIGSLHDLKDSYKDLLQLLGLNVQKANEFKEAATVTDVTSSVGALESNVAPGSSNTENLTATTELTDAQEKATEATTALTAAETEQGTVTAANTEAIIAQTASQTELNVATEGAAEMQAANVAGLEATTVAEESAEVASISLGAALKAVGIGLVIAAIAYLITNFQSIKKSVTDLFPGLKDAGKLFNQFKEICYGVGNVILQYIIAPIKAIVDAVKGNFKQAVQDLKDGLNIVANFNKGVAYEANNIAIEAGKKRVALEIEANERIIKERKALGESTYALEQLNTKLKIQQLDKDKLSDEEYNKQKLDLESDATVAYNAELKKRSDKYKELLKTDLDAIKANEKENFKVVQEGSADQRGIELADIDTRYNAELALLNKRRTENKKYAKDVLDLNTATNIERARVNKKYDDQAYDYLNTITDDSLNTFEKKEAEIQKKLDELLKNASPELAALLKRAAAIETDNLKTQDKATSFSSQQSTVEVQAEDDNRPVDGDTPESAAKKVTRIEVAKIDAENAAYAAKKLALAGQNDELAALEADHNKKINDIDAEGVATRKELAQDEADAKLKLFDAVAQGASAASDLIGDSTIAGKALAVAAATISTYTAIAGQLAAFSSVPIPGYAIVQAIATGIVGLAQVKKILSVQVPAKSGNSSSGAGAVAPVINSTVLQQANTGTQDVVDAVNQKNTAPQAPLKAYIVNKDLKDQDAKNQYYAAQSTY